MNKIKIPQIIYKYTFPFGFGLKYRYCFVWHGYAHYIDYPTGCAWLNHKPDSDIDEKVFRRSGWKKVLSKKDIHNIKTSLKNIKNFEMVTVNNKAIK